MAVDYAVCFVITHTERRANSKDGLVLVVDYHILFQQH